MSPGHRQSRLMQPSLDAWIVANAHPYCSLQLLLSPSIHSTASNTLRFNKEIISIIQQLVCSLYRKQEFNTALCNWSVIRIRIFYAQFMQSCLIKHPQIMNLTRFPYL